MNLIPSINSSKRIVIKIGSSLLFRKKQFNFEWLDSLLKDILILKKNSIDIALVVSGAVSLGREYLNLKNKKLKINHKQACAACGQVILMQNFMKSFKKKKIKVAQLLLTFADTEDRKKSLNSRETINTLVNSNIIPIINENDTVATEELKFGDNDRLASRVAQIFGAQNLILLSDVDGLFDKNPKKNNKAKLIPVIKKIDKKIINMASRETNFFGSGGMSTKIQAAEIASSFGCNTLICSGKTNNPISNYLKNKKGTWFLSSKKSGSSFKNWLAGTIKVAGRVLVDDGALKALLSGASLLPSGIKKISGKFYRGDIIEIMTLEGQKIGKGISFYDSLEIEKIRGRKTSDIKNLLGYLATDEVIHRDNLSLNE